MPHRGWPRMGHLRQRKREVGPYWYSLLSQEQCLESTHHQGAADLGQSFAFQIHHLEWCHPYRQQIQISGQNKLERNRHQLSAGWKQQDDRLPHLPRQSELHDVVAPGSSQQEKSRLLE